MAQGNNDVDNNSPNPDREGRHFYKHSESELKVHSQKYYGRKECLSCMSRLDDGGDGTWCRY